MVNQYRKNDSSHPLSQGLSGLWELLTVVLGCGLATENHSVPISQCTHFISPQGSAQRLIRAKLPASNCMHTHIFSFILSSRQSTGKSSRIEIPLPSIHGCHTNLHQVPTRFTFHRSITNTINYSHSHNSINVHLSLESYIPRNHKYIILINHNNHFHHSISTA